MINIFKKIYYILEGWLKYILSTIKFYRSGIAEKRLLICNNCKYRKGGFCERCGCYIKAKVNVNYYLNENGISIEGCPEKKW